jgi:hypothetical protein
LFFVGSLLLSPGGYLLGTSLGGSLARSLVGLEGHETSSSSTALWLIFGGALVWISALNLLLFLWLAPSFALGLSNKAMQPTGAPSGAGG